VASFAFGGSAVSAQVSETEASALPVAAAELNVNKEAIACDSSDAAVCKTEAEADALPASAAPEVDQVPAAVSEAEPAATEPATPGITSYDAVVVDIVETVTVAVPGDQSAEETPEATGALTLEDAITPPAPTTEEPAVGATDADIFDELE
jgi:hypothetical protein